MEKLPSAFSRLLTPEMRDAAERSYQNQFSVQNSNIRVIPPDHRTDYGSLFGEIDEGGDNDSIRDQMLNSFINKQTPRFPIPKRLPCANVEVDQYKACNNPGTMACSRCKLVSYCSKECQKCHWRVHKRDCKDPMLGKDWKPAWIMENRRASFLATETPREEFLRKGREEFSSGLFLWGNMPATDVLNLPQNEKDATKDFSLAFIASGDLRHVIRTVNSLPSNFSGSLNILINDYCLPIVCRNIILLLILGTISDEDLAADVALHFWYSTFMPDQYRLRISALILSKVLPQDRPVDSMIVISCPLGQDSTLSFALPNEAARYFSHYCSTDSTISQVQDEYDRIRNAPSRRDYRERMYARLKPPHRVAFREFRRYGIVLPFGAVNTHFNVPNISLFSFEGKWLQTDYADPLEGWDLDEVIEVGKTYGATLEDIYGCLYFFLTTQLRTFTERLRQIPVTLNIYPLDARGLSKFLRNGKLPGKVKTRPSTRYDRIEVSNILDANYVGLRGVLTDWAPLLAETKSAAIIGYFMNWFLIQEDGRASGAGKIVCESIIDKILDGKVLRHVLDFGDMETIIYLISGDMDALYENSKPFEKFLRKQGLENALQQTRLKRRERHTIVPHRLLAALNKPADALPDFPDEESWYRRTQLSATNSWGERFVEFVRK